MGVGRSRLSGCRAGVTAGTGAGRACSVSGSAVTGGATVLAGIVVGLAVRFAWISGAVAAMLAAAGCASAGGRVRSAAPSPRLLACVGLGGTGRASTAWSPASINSSSLSAAPMIESLAPVSLPRSPRRRRRPPRRPRRRLPSPSAAATALSALAGLVAFASAPTLLASSARSLRSLAGSARASGAATAALALAAVAGSLAAGFDGRAGLDSLRGVGAGLAVTFLPAAGSWRCPGLSVRASPRPSRPSRPSRTLRRSSRLRSRPVPRPLPALARAAELPRCAAAAVAGRAADVPGAATASLRNQAIRRAHSPIRTGPATVVAALALGVGNTISSASTSGRAPRPTGVIRLTAGFSDSTSGCAVIGSAAGAATVRRS